MPKHYSGDITGGGSMIRTPTHFVDGTPIPPGYQERVTQAIHDACMAEDLIGIDLLEMYVEDTKQGRL